MYNRSGMVGRLTKDVDLRYTGSGVAVGAFTLAVTRDYKNQQGEYEADFINCVIWKKGAENLARMTRKGSLISVDGRLQTRNYENAQGQRIYATEVLVQNFYLLEKKKDEFEGNNYNQSYQSTSNSSDFKDYGDVELDDDDLPF